MQQQMQQQNKQMQQRNNQMQQQTQQLQLQIGQMATAINRLEAQVGGKLPSQPEANPKNVSAMTLRSGKEVEGPKVVIPVKENEDEV